MLKIDVQKAFLRPICSKRSLRTDPPAACSWTGAQFQRFARYFGSLGLLHFTAAEFLVLGQAHYTEGAKGYGLNHLPPESLWPNIARTARVLDQCRKNLNVPIAISSSYRSPQYNAAIGGTPKSQHLRFRAVDISSSMIDATKIAQTLQALRDEDKLFKGGIGLYPKFVHLDTRGWNANWGP